MVIQKRLMTLPTLRRAIEYHVDSFMLEAPSPTDLYQAIQAQEDHKLPFWDALLWATARRSGCKIVFSEDFQDGRELGGVRFINPFNLTRRELQRLTS